MIQLRMLIAILVIVLIYGGTFGAFWITSVHTLTLYPISQSYSWEIVPLANNGGSDNFEIMSWRNGHNMRGWIEFNLTSIPQQVWITSAVLSLRLWQKTTPQVALSDQMGNLSQIGDPTGRTYGVYALSSPWTDEGINWANQPNWTDYHHAESSVPSGQGGWNGPLIYMNWDLTGMVKDWMSGVPNYGMVVRDTQENASLLYSTQFFTIHQTPNPTYYPTLLVTYVSPLAVVSFGIVLVAEGFLMIILWRTKVKRARH